MLTWALLGLLVAIGVYGLVRTAAARYERGWLPRDLRGAKLVYAERLFRSRNPALVAKVDRVYRRRGRNVLLELKTRPQHRAYASDVIELSVQRLAVAEETGEEVGVKGYVLTSRPGHADKKAHRVKLMNGTEVEWLIARRERILDGREEPRYAAHHGVCRSCGFRRECRPPHE